MNIPRAMLSPSAPPATAVENLGYTRPEVIPLPGPHPPVPFALPQHTVNMNATNASSSSQPQVIYVVGSQNEKQEMDCCTECGAYILWRIIVFFLAFVFGLIIYFVVRATK